MIPVSHVGADNYALLGNRLTGETHTSRMARVNAVDSDAPALVGNLSPPVHIPNTGGLGPWGLGGDARVDYAPGSWFSRKVGLAGKGGSIMGGFDALVYGAITGIVIGGVAGQSKNIPNTKQARKYTALVAGAVGATVGVIAHRGKPFGTGSIGGNPILGVPMGLFIGAVLAGGLWSIAGSWGRFSTKTANAAIQNLWPLAAVPAAVVGLSISGFDNNKLYAALVGGALAALAVGVGHRFAKKAFD